MGKSKFRPPQTIGLQFVSKQNLDKVVLPSKITCRLCQRSRTATIGFSNKQLDMFKNGIATRAITPATEADPCWIVCTDCTAKQKTEMLCSQCEHWLGFDGFTKAQRKTPDSATCRECVYKNLTTAPIIGTGEDASREFSDDDSIDSDDNKTNPYGQSDAGVRLPETPSDRLNEENLKSIPSVSGTASAWQAYANSGAANTHKYTAYDPQGRAHTKVYEPSVADTEESRATTQATRLTERERKDLTSKFARPRGPRTELAAPTPYIGGRAAQDNDDSGSDDSYGYI